MSEIHFLIDENVDDALRKGLHLHYPDIVAWRIGDPDAPPFGTLDPDILVWCEEHMRDHLEAGRHVPGMFTINANMSIGDTIEQLAIIAGASSPDEYADQMNYLPIRR